MYKNRFKSRTSALSRASNASTAGSSGVGSPNTSISSTLTTSAIESPKAPPSKAPTQKAPTQKTMEQKAPTQKAPTQKAPTQKTPEVKTPPAKRGRPPGAASKRQNFPSEETFLAPAPSPKNTTPTRRKPMRESNSAESSPVLNVIRRKARKAVDPESPYFERIMAVCGLKFQSRGDIPHELDQEQIFFIRDLQEQMTKTENKNQIKEFLNKLLELLSDDMRLLKKSMSHTRREVGDDGAFVNHDSLIHLLLEIPCFQSRIFEFLYEKLLEHVTEANERKTIEGLNCIQWTKLILLQMSDLSSVGDPEELTSKLLEAFEFCQSPKVQKVFLEAFPSIIYGENQHDVARCLSKVLKEGGENTPQLLDALCDLAASAEVKDLITENVVTMLKSGDRKFMPQVIAFLLTQARYGDDKAKIIRDLRVNADLVPFGINEELLKEDKAMLKKVVASIGGGLNAMEEVGELWVNYISNAQALKPIDVIALVCLYGQAKQNKLLAVIKSRCATGAISEQLLDTTFSHHGEALCEYFDNIMGIAAFLIKSPDKTVSRCGSEWFKLLFLHVEATFLRHKVLWGLINLLGVYSTQATDSVLSTLSGLVSNHMDQVLPQAALLMVPESLLDKVEIVSLEHARKIMDIVCQLAYSDHSQADMLQSDINILIQKQLRSLTIQTKRKGVVGAVMATKHMAASVDEDSKSTVNTTETPSKEDVTATSLGLRGIAAQSLIELAFKSTSRNPEVFGFLYDELASMFNCGNVCLKFEDWLMGVVSQTFEELYAVDSDFDPRTVIRDIRLKEYLNLIREENPIIIGIGILVAKEVFNVGQSSNNVMAFSTTACAVLRLMRILFWLVNEGKLNDIDAVLASPIYMPAAILDVTRGSFISMTDPLEQKCILNTLFVTVNWLRELISAFCVCDLEAEEEDLRKSNTMMRSNVMKRIRHVVYIESKILELMPVFPKDYVPPVCQFYSEIIPPKLGSTGKKGKKKRSKKKKSPITQSSLHPALDTEDNALDEDDDETDFDDEDLDKNGANSEHTLKELSAYFREMDLSITALLSEKLVFEPTPVKGEEVSDELGPSELMFLLDDLFTKLEHALDKKPGLLSAKKAKAFNFGGDNEKMTALIKSTTPLTYHLDQFDKKLVAKNIVASVSFMCDKLEQIVTFFQDLQEKNDGLLDGPGSDTEHARKLHQCLYLLICCIKSILSWTGFYEEVNEAKTREMLGGMAQRVSADADGASNSKIISLACEYFINFGKFVLNMPTAVALVELIQVINSHDPDDDGDDAKANKKKIYNLAVSFIKQDWPAASKDYPAEPVLVTSLVQTVLSNCSCKMMKCLKFLGAIEDGGEELKGRNSSGKIESLPTINKTTLPSVYKLLASVVVEEARAACTEPEALTQAEGTKSELTLKAWAVVVEALQKMTAIAKFHETKPLFACLFKEAQPIFRLFMEDAMPVLDKCFTKYTKEVHVLLRQIQRITRFLQQLCCHGKRTNSLGLVSQVPNMKFILEKLVQRVKGMMVVNKCVDVMWIGSLKNKDIHGEDIPSQMVESGSEDDEERQVRRRTQKSQRKSPKTQKSQAKTQKTQKTQQSPAVKEKKKKSLKLKAVVQESASEEEEMEEEEPESAKKRNVTREVVAESEDNEDDDDDGYQEPDEDEEEMDGSSTTSSRKRAKESDNEESQVSSAKKKKKKSIISSDDELDSD